MSRKETADNSIKKNGIDNKIGFKFNCLSFLFIAGILISIIIFSEIIYAVESNLQATVQVIKSFVTINSPVQDAVYNTRRILFNISVQENAKLLEYINYNSTYPRWKALCTDLSNRGNCDSYAKYAIFREGENNVIVRATSFSGKVYYASVYFRVDTRAPRIKKVFPTKTTDGEFKVMYTELNPVNVILFYGLNPNPENMKELKGCGYGTNIWCNTTLDLTSYQGKQIYYSFLVKDYFKERASRVKKISVNLTVSPKITEVASDELQTLQESLEDIYDLLFWDYDDWF